MQSPRIFNQTRQYWMKPKRAIYGVENYVYAWVEFGVSVRDLTLAESIALRNQIYQLRDPLPFAELPNCVFRFSDYAAVIRERIAAFEANQFAELATS